MSEVRSSDFWERRFQEGRTGWDLGGPTPAFVQLLKDPAAPRPGKILIPGCGYGHDVLLFARHGFDALGVDFAPTAIERATEAAASAGLAGRARFEHGNIFDLAAPYLGHFDYVLERACYCAIDPVDRSRYVETMASVLRPDGRIYALFFRGPQTRPGPPFATTAEELRQMFEPHFAIERLDEPLQGELNGADFFGVLRRI